MFTGMFLLPVLKNTKMAPQLVIYRCQLIIYSVYWELFSIVFNRNKFKEKVFGILICVTKCISIFCFYKQNSKDGTATIYNEDGRFQYNISDVSNQESELGGLFLFFFGNLETEWHITSVLKLLDVFFIERIW